MPLKLKALPSDSAILLLWAHVNFTVEHGESFGFLGPNGAGKTTTVRMIAGLIKPDASRASIMGHDVERCLKCETGDWRPA